MAWRKKDIRHHQKMAKTHARHITDRTRKLPFKYWNGDWLSTDLKMPPKGLWRQVIIRLDVLLEEKEIVQRLEKAFGDLE